MVHHFNCFYYHSEAGVIKEFLAKYYHVSSLLVHDSAQVGAALGGRGEAFVFLEGVAQRLCWSVLGAWPGVSLSPAPLHYGPGSSCMPGLLLSSCSRVRAWPWRIACSLNIFYSIKLAVTPSAIFEAGMKLEVWSPCPGNVSFPLCPGCVQWAELRCCWMCPSVQTTET